MFFRSSVGCSVFSGVEIALDVRLNHKQLRLLGPRAANHEVIPVSEHCHILGVILVRVDPACPDWTETNLSCKIGRRSRVQSRKFHGFDFSDEFAPLLRPRFVDQQMVPEVAFLKSPQHAKLIHDDVVIVLRISAAQALILCHKLCDTSSALFCMRFHKSRDKIPRRTTNTVEENWVCSVVLILLCIVQLCVKLLLQFSNMSMIPNKWNSYTLA